MGSCSWRTPPGGSCDEAPPRARDPLRPRRGSRLPRLCPRLDTASRPAPRRDDRSALRGGRRRLARDPPEDAMTLRRLGTAAAALLLARRAFAEPLRETHYGLPRDVSLDGHRIDELIHFTLVGSVLVFVVVAAVMVYALVRH